MTKVTMLLRHNDPSNSSSPFSVIDYHIFRRAAYGFEGDNDKFSKNKFSLSETSSDGSNTDITLKGKFKLSENKKLSGIIKSITYSFTEEGKKSIIKIGKIDKAHGTINPESSNLLNSDAFFSGNDTFTIKSLLPKGYSERFDYINTDTKGGNDVIKIQGEGIFNVTPGEGKDKIISYTKNNVTPEISYDGECNNPTTLEFKGIKVDIFDYFERYPVSTISSFRLVREDNTIPSIFVSSCPAEDYTII